jgi:predicted PurR-regulated permease PerM
MKESTIKTVISILTILLCAYGVYIFRGIIGYLLISVALSFAGRPIVTAISRIKIKGRSLPTFVGAIAALSSFIIVGGLIIGMFGPLIAAQIEALSTLNPREIAGDVKGWVAFIDKIIVQLNLSHDSLSSLLIDSTSDLVGLGGVSSLFTGVFNFIGNAFIAVFSILFMTFFFLKDAQLFHRIIIAITPDSQVEHIKNIMASSSHLLTRYFSGLIVQIAIVTIMVTSGLAIIGAENALLLGFIAGIFNLIPYIGPLISAVIGIVIVTTTYTGDTSGWAAHVGGAAIVYLVTQLFDNFFTQPVIFSNRVNAHPLEIFIVISMAGLLGGVSGMVLAVPVYTLLRIVANEFLSGHKVVDALTKKIEE